MRKRKIQNMTTEALQKRMSHLRSEQPPNKEKTMSNQMKYINYHLKKRGVK